MSPFIFLHCTIFILTISSILAIGEGMFDKIKAGLQNAKNYLETARDIADLVSESLRLKETENKRGANADFTNEQGNKPFELTNLMSTFFRFLGLDTKKITAVTINSFIFFAQMISELFKLTPKVEHFEDMDENRDPVDLVKLITESKNEKIQNLLRQAEDKGLPSQLMEKADFGNSPCIKLLLCKLSPIIWAAQKSLKNGSIRGQRDITSWLPSKNQFETYSDTCDDNNNDSDAYIEQ
ncbi:PREDICTED: uncharacterized protein LOC105359971 [Ceratosolen solmsi marchali]|uniref:Uncharacterized protein LOC105359971 n=1 Tax=Ceratosolen solmsi marchali TaxID=326594 RepID=A0AAJ6YC53_9HYME|nr:PREDICTED: uncharacterized protein LOC105359971 [Ceratosolen solmsi marchali]